MTVTFAFAIDWDNDGSFATAGDDITAYVVEWKSSQGNFYDFPTRRTAATGRLTLILDNADRRFSPLYTSGALYGKLLPGLPVRVQATDGVTTWTLFRGFTRDFLPDPGSDRGAFARLTCEDLLSQLQAATISLPLQQSETPKTILDKITATAFQGAAATGYVEFYDMPKDATTITIGAVTYTFADTLSGAANEVLIESVSGDGEHTMLHLAAAINQAAGESTDYGTGTTRHPYVTATARRALGNPEAEGDTWIPLRDTGSTFDALSVSDFFTSGTIVTDKVVFWMRKVGSPTGTATVKIYTSTNFVPDESNEPFSGVTGTFSEADLTTVGHWVVVTLSSAVTLQRWTRYHFVITTDRAASGTNYIEWRTKADTTGVSGTKNGGTWTNTGDFNCWWIPGRVDLTANARGTWANAIDLFAESTHYDADTVTLNTGTLVTGDVTSVATENEDYYQVAEVTGTPGFDVEFQASGVTGTATAVHWRGRYAGGAGHTVEMQAYNGGTWDTVGTIVEDTVDAIFEYALLSTHTIAGVVRVRFYHVSAGNITHDLYVDHIYFDTDDATAPDGIHLSGVDLAGGTAGVPIASDFDTGVVVPTYAGDAWAQGQTNAMTAVQDVTDTEFGLFWVARSGAMTFRDVNFMPEQAATAAALTLTGTHYGQDAAQLVTDIYNKIAVQYTPRGTASTGVIAKANSPIKVERGGSERWSPSDALQDNTVVIPYVESTTGNIVGATEIVVPVASTDYTVNSESDGSGVNQTNNGHITVSLAINGGDIEATFVNTGRRFYYVRGFQVRGTALIRYETQTVLETDSTSIAAYQERTLSYVVPFEVNNGDIFARALAQFILNNRKDPSYIISSITMRLEQPYTIGATNILSLEIGNVVSLSEYQTGVTEKSFIIQGIEMGDQSGGDALEVKWFLRALSSNTYWILNDSTYGLLGSTTRLAISGAHVPNWTNSIVVGAVDFNVNLRDPMQVLYDNKPVRYIHSHIESTVTAGNAIAITVDTGQLHTFYAQQSASALNDAFTFSCVLLPGTYNMYTFGQTTANSGSFIIQRDSGPIIGEGDAYTGTTIKNSTYDTAVFTVTEMKRYKFTYTVNGKNASSGGYDLRITHIAIVPLDGD